MEVHLTVVCLGIFHATFHPVIIAEPPKGFFVVAKETGSFWYSNINEKIFRTDPLQ